MKTRSLESLSLIHISKISDDDMGLYYKDAPYTPHTLQQDVYKRQVQILTEIVKSFATGKNVD